MTEHWVWISRIPYIGPVTVNRLLEEFGTPERIYDADMHELSLSGLLDKRQRNMLWENRSLDGAKRIIDRCCREQIGILTLEDDRYDERARFADSPSVLYYKGDLRRMGATAGVVGARRCTRQARQAAIDCAREYAGCRTSVISGMAKGVDAYAHTACLKAGGYTVAFLANGLDICYPKEHDSLMRSIIERGAVMSEHPPGTPPDRFRFPGRNRLIAQWSDRVDVIGAGRGSGALITAELAGKYGKEVGIKCDR